MSRTTNYLTVALMATLIIGGIAVAIAQQPPGTETVVSKVWIPVYDHRGTGNIREYYTFTAAMPYHIILELNRVANEGGGNDTLFYLYTEDRGNITNMEDLSRIPVDIQTVKEYYFTVVKTVFAYIIVNPFYGSWHMIIEEQRPTTNATSA